MSRNPKGLVSYYGGTPLAERTKEELLEIVTEIDAQLKKVRSTLAKLNKAQVKELGSNRPGLTKHDVKPKATFPNEEI